MSLLQILPVGATSGLFQVCAGQQFGHIEIEGFDDRWERGRDIIARRSDVITYVMLWLRKDGALVGSVHPPRLTWATICRDVPAARGLLH